MILKRYNSFSLCWQSNSTHVPCLVRRYTSWQPSRKNTLYTLIKSKEIMEKILKETWKQAFRKAGWSGEVPPVALPYKTESERIIKFIEFHNLESVQGLRDPLTKEDASWLLSRYPAGVIEDTLLDMENF